MIGKVIKNNYHRDLRPANIMVTADEVVKLMDFGISEGVGLSQLFDMTSISASQIPRPLGLFCLIHRCSTHVKSWNQST